MENKVGTVYYHDRDRTVENTKQLTEIFYFNICSRFL